MIRTTPDGESLWAGRARAAAPVFADGWSTSGARASSSTRSCRSATAAVGMLYAVRRRRAGCSRVAETFRFLFDFWWQLLLAGALAAAASRCSSPAGSRAA